MLKINRPELAFAIEFKANKASDAKESFIKLVKHISNSYPSSRIEGINVPKRKSKKTYVPLIELGKYALTEIKVDSRNLICVGVSDVFDISFEKKKDLVSTFNYKDNYLMRREGIEAVNVSKIPILDIEKDMVKITMLLARYYSSVYRTNSLRNLIDRAMKSATTAPVLETIVRFHSSFVQVGNEVMSYENYRAKTGTTRKVVEKVTVPGKPDLNTILAGLLA